MCVCVRWNNTTPQKKQPKNSQQLDLFLGEKRDLTCWKQLLWRLNERAASTETLQGQDLTVALCQTSGRNTKCSLETQWRWRDLRRFTHLIVRPEWRSSPRRQVWLTSEAEARIEEKKSQTNEINKKKTEGKSAEKTRIYTRKRGSHQRYKEAHLDDFLVRVEREWREQGRYSRGAGLSTPITIPHWFSSSREDARLQLEHNFSVHTLRWFTAVFQEVTAVCLCRTFRLSLGRSVGLCRLIGVWPNPPASK